MKPHFFAAAAAALAWTFAEWIHRGTPMPPVPLGISHCGWVDWWIGGWARSVSEAREAGSRTGVEGWDEKEGWQADWLAGREGGG